MGTTREAEEGGMEVEEGGMEVEEGEEGGTDHVSSILSSMSIKDKIMQMAQVDISQLVVEVDADVVGATSETTRTKKKAYVVSPDKAHYYFHELGVGSVLNAPFHTSDHAQWTASDFRSALIAIRNASSTASRPPPIWGIDSVHGANYVYGSVVMPQQLSLAATFNVTTARVAGWLSSKDTRAAGISWIFAPILGLAVEPTWPRVYETFGEDPMLASVMGAALIGAIQEPGILGGRGARGRRRRGLGKDGSGEEMEARGPYRPSLAAACGKHFVGYSAPYTGHDRAPSRIPTRQLYQYFLKPWRAAINKVGPWGSKERRQGADDDDDEDKEQDGDDRSGVLTVMESYTETDGVPNVSNRRALGTVLRDELGFDGVLVTDYREIWNLNDFHHVARDNDEAAKLALRDGTVDMSMVPLDIEGWRDAVLSALGEKGDGAEVVREDDSGGHESADSSPPSPPPPLPPPHSTPYPYLPQSIDEGRIHDSVERILRLKDRLNMFDEDIIPTDVDPFGVGSDSDRDAALDAARQSIVLVQNDNDEKGGSTLPLRSVGYSESKIMKNKSHLRVHVVGPTSHSVSCQSGGWTVEWQGSGIDDSRFWYGTTVVDAATIVEGWDVTHGCGVDIMGRDCGDTTVEAMSFASDVVIVCIGEEPYAEKPGDIRDLRLPEGQVELIRKVRASAGPKTKIVAVYFGGRPRLLGPIPSLVESVVIAFLPGPDGGQAVVDIISGTIQPSGRLPITYPKYPDGAGVPYYHPVTDLCTSSDSGGPLPHYVTAPCEVQWPFGHGLAYANIEYSGLGATADEIVFVPSFYSRVVVDNDGGKNDDGAVRRRARRTEEPSEEAGVGADTDTYAYTDESSTVEVSVVVTNHSPTPASHSVLFFVFDESRYVTPEYKRLQCVEKIHLDAGEGATVSCRIAPEDMRHVGPYDDSHYVLQPGMRFRVGVGPDADCRRSGLGGDDDEGVDDRLCTGPISLTVPPGVVYVGACEAACAAWDRSECGAEHDMDTKKCWDLCVDAAESDDLEGGYEGWGWNYVRCVESVSRNIVSSTAVPGEAKCQRMTTLCRDIFWTPDGEEVWVIGPAAFFVVFLVGTVGVIIMLFVIHRRGKSAVRFLKVLEEEPEDGVQLVPYKDKNGDEVNVD